MSKAWKEVTKDEFYGTVGQLNVHPQIQPGPFPWWELWKMLDGTRRIMGKTVDRREGGHILTRYYVPKEAN